MWGYLFGYSRHGGISLVGCSRFGENVYLDSFGAVWVAGVMCRVAVCTADWRVGAGRALLACWKGTRMLFGFVGACTDITAAGVLV